MDIRKFLAIVRRDIIILFKDTPTLLIILGAPLVLTFIISAAFSGMGSGGGGPIRDIPVLVVNQDAGTAMGNMGEQIARIFTDPPAGALADLLNGAALSDADEARQRVRKGVAAAAIIIPPDFSERLMMPGGENKVHVEVYRDVGSPLSSEIVYSITNQMVNGLATGSIAAGAAARADLALLSQVAAIGQEVGQRVALDPPIQVRSSLSQPEASGQRGSGLNLLQYFAPAMAVFFLNFTAAFGVLSIMEERERWTLQRMLVTPTSRATILVGKLGSAYVNGVIQLTILVIAMSLFAPITGSSAPVWGTNIPGLALMIVVVAAASVGLGTLIAGVAKDRVQAAVLINAVMIVMGIAGGTFFASGSGAPPLGTISLLTLNWWATEGFMKLARTDVVPLQNVAALLVIFVVCFGVGLALFRRRLDM